MAKASQYGSNGSDDGVEHHPVDAQGRPDLGSFAKQSDDYARLHHVGIANGNLDQRVEGLWGLIADGRASVPYLASLLNSADPEARADGAAGLAEIGEIDPTIQSQLIAASGAADTHEEIDTLGSRDDQEQRGYSRYRTTDPFCGH